MKVSVREQLSCRTVLLTGGLGGVGSACLEQLLRQTDVASVLLLARGNAHLTPEERVHKVLSGPIFQTLHKQASAGFNVFQKVHIIEGDLTQPGLGLTDANRSLLLQQTNLILHCAADLSLQAPIQRTLRANYLSTQQLLQLAGSMTQLESFVYVSTYYVSNFKPFNSRVKEEVHRLPLQLPGSLKPLTHAQLVAQLLGMTSKEADQQATVLMLRLHFEPTYAFGKLLTEHLVDDPATLPGVAKVIVRPSLVNAYAGGPYPGYCTGLQGAPMYQAGYGAGLFHSIESVAFADDAFVDIIPVDVVSSLIIAAGAAAAARGPSPGNAAIVYHACSTDSHPLPIRVAYQYIHKFYSANPCPTRLPFARLPVFKGTHIPTDKSLKRTKSLLWFKVKLATVVLRLYGKGSKARLLNNQVKIFNAQNTTGMNRSFISQVDNARELQASIAADEAADWTCVFEQEGSMSWEEYYYRCLTGLHNRLYNIPVASVKTPIPHGFVLQEGLLSPSLLRQWMKCTNGEVHTVTGLTKG